VLGARNKIIPRDISAKTPGGTKGEGVSSSTGGGRGITNSRLQIGRMGHLGIVLFFYKHMQKLKGVQGSRKQNKIQKKHSLAQKKSYPWDISSNTLKLPGGAKDEGVSSSTGGGRASWTNSLQAMTAWHHLDFLAKLGARIPTTCYIPWKAD
jgi:hypothetical protein